MNFLPVNWQDGMKVNKDHFVGTEYALRSEMRHHVYPFLSGISYGLLPEKVGKTSLDIYVKLDQSQEMVVSLVHCQAITPAGALVEITHEMQQQEAVRISEQSLRQMLEQAEKIYIKVELKPNERIPFGDPDPEEDPPRLPHTRPKFQVSPSHDPQGYEFSLPIACIKNVNGSIELDASYIPPSLTMASCPQLKSHLNQWGRQLTQLYNNGLHTVARIREYRRKQGGRPAPAEDNRILFDFTEESSPQPSYTSGNQIFVGNVVEVIVGSMLRSLANMIPKFQNMAEFSPPVYTLTLLQEMARNMFLSYSVLGVEEKNRLLNYLSEAMEVRDFKDKHLQLIKAKYVHHDIQDSFEKAAGYMDMLSKLFDQREGFPSKDFSWTEVTGVFGDMRTRNQTLSVEIDTLD
ncbi:MAG: type VI secretion system baseplate subunit TssK [Bacteroidota bacterium]